MYIFALRCGAAAARWAHNPEVVGSSPTNATIKMKGKIKFFNSEKGYGFIVPDDNSPDIFFHVTGFEDRETEPQENDEVEYEIKNTKRGVNADKIKFQDRINNY